jgi:hypothetical protein
MDSRSYIKLTGNLTNITGSTGTTGGTVINMLQQPLKTCIVNIGYWNMNHGTGGFTRGKALPLPTSIATNKVRGVDAFICADSGGGFYPMVWAAGTNLNDVGGRVWIDNSRNIQLERNDNGFFNASGFQGVGNRGFATVLYSNIKPPSGTTGVAANVLPTTMNVNTNIVTNNGNDTLTEYGVVFSQITSTPTISACKVFTAGDIAIGTPYNKSISGLADNTVTYFRAYAKNCEEVGYGVVCSQLMPAAPPATDVTVCLNVVSEYGQDSNGFIEVLDPLATGQYVTVQLNTMQTAENNGDSAAFRVYSASTVGGYFYEIYPITPSPVINYYCSNANGSGYINIYKNSCVCWCNSVQSGGGYNPLCSRFMIHAVGGSVGIIPHTGSPYMECVPV